MKKSANSSAATFKLANGRVLSRDEIIADYRLAFQSRVASIIGRKEVLTGKAKFGIFGDGKELAQIAAAKAFQNGDIRSGYYRDQTFMFATGMVTITQYFAQLFSDTNIENEPHSGGRQMNSHYGSRLLDTSGQWRSQIDSKNTSSDISPTGGQMARLLGLAYASKIYRNEPALKDKGGLFSRQGNEVAFGTIGDASTSEGIFWETMNAAGVLQVPLAMSVWDDGYGISVPRELQTTKGSISEALKGFQRTESHPKGFEIHVLKGWDYPSLISGYLTGIEQVRKEHVPALFHIVEITQPQGHSTSGSHERYKSKERLAWEEEYCCIKKMRTWMLDFGFAKESDFEAWEAEDRIIVESARSAAWEAYLTPIKNERASAIEIIEQVASQLPAFAESLNSIAKDLRTALSMNRKSIDAALFKSMVVLRGEKSPIAQSLCQFYSKYRAQNLTRYNSHLYSESAESPLLIPEIKAQYSENSESADARVVLLRCFDAMFARDPRVFSIGEDVGKLGDVNLVFEGLSAKYGDLRNTDTGIREATILGQGIGAALRGLRPLVDIQYLDYLLYALQVMSDDLATLHFRTAGGQKAPVIVRTKGHRLEGIWHTGSPIGMILNAIRGIYVCVPRNMTQAAGMYNLLLQGDNPALVIEVLNGYRIKERVPNNVDTFTVPLGMPETMREGTDLTVVTYGACVKVAQDAAIELQKLGIEIEIIDVQTLIPFDISSKILQSIQKTNSVLFFDEDVPGGASAYMMQKTLENQNAYDWLDSRPRTLSATDNRSGYGSDADHFCKPGIEHVVETVYGMMRERFPHRFPSIF